ncbi:sensor histidine kinase [Rhodanobacter terrae]|uniref:histidine kinase n=1 Tax=Rhodanobacter terrae TaxID=418647 RepID=A0ABW0T0H8_9GAMM
MKVRGLRWSTVGMLLAVLVIVALPYVVTLSNSRDAQQAAAWVTHSNIVKSLTYQVAYAMQDSESACYRLLAGDGNDSTRKRALLAGQQVPRLLRQLRAMTRDNPNQQTAISALESGVDGRIALMSHALSRLRQGDAAGARQSLRDGGDLFAIDSEIADIVQNEDGLLKARQANAGKQIFNGRVVLSITALAQLLLLTIIVIMSERQIGQRRLAETREGRAVLRSQLIFQAVREPIALFDKDLNSLLVNNAFRELYGMEPGRNAQPLAGIGDGAWNDNVLLQRLNDVLLRDRELWDHDVIQRTVDGIDRHVVINARRLQQQDTDAPALLLTVSDVTTRALAEQKVSELNRQLEGKVAQISDVNRELEAFSYSVSHDLRAPLRHISGFARKLEHHLGGHADDKANHYIEIIAGSAQRMAQLIDDLLVFSRLGRGPLRLQAIDMQSVVDEARSLAESEAQDRRIVWKIAPLPMVIGDENMLRTVWQNLLGNAVKYTGHCEVARIEVSVQQGRRGDYEFTVADNGAGFDMQYADKLFGVFQRLHRASDFPGNGIGLANVRRIVARHGGRVWAEAEPGQGARFHFSLPATDAAGAPIESRA